MRLHQYIRFLVGHTSLIMSLNTKSLENHWFIRPEYPSDVGMEKLRRILAPLKCEFKEEGGVPFGVLRTEGAEYHTISDGIALCPKWDGKSLEGLMSATATLICCALTEISEKLGVKHFRRFDNQKIRYKGYDNPNSVFLMSGLEIGDEYDAERIRLYEWHHLIRYEDPPELEERLPGHSEQWLEQLEREEADQRELEDYLADYYAGHYGSGDEDDDLPDDTEEWREWEEERDAQEERWYAHLEQVENSFL